MRASGDGRLGTTYWSTNREMEPSYSEGGGLIGIAAGYLTPIWSAPSASTSAESGAESGSRHHLSQYELTFFIREVSCLLFFAFSSNRLMAMATAV